PILIFFQDQLLPLKFEQIFSGGRDTISLRCASLKPETIRNLMLIKCRLILAHEKK
ncbi:hypothetical protein BYT27DRAFT_7107091, partial [Phlegmacium glaucopus]